MISTVFNNWYGIQIPTVLNVPIPKHIHNTQHGNNYVKPGIILVVIW